MRLISSWLGLGLLWSLHTWGWMSKKCEIIDGSEVNLYANWDCKPRKYTAECEDITDFKKDLAGLPALLQAIVISTQMRDISLLSPNTFSAFHSLEVLVISACLMEILPGAFQGLTNLQCLRILSHDAHVCSDTSIKQHTFSDLPNLRVFALYNYRISAMKPEVFSEAPQIEELAIFDSGIQEVTDVLCRVINVASLKKLYIGTETQILKHRNCSSLNMTVGKIPDFYSQDVSLYLEHINFIEKDALKYFRNLSFLSISDSKLVLSELPLSGLRRVLSFTYSTTAEIDLEKICKTVLMFSIEYLSLEYKTIISCSVYSVKNCVGLKGMELYGDGADLDLKYIHVLKNLTTLRVVNNNLNHPEFKLLCKYQSDPIISLTKMFLKFCQISIITARQFCCLPNLEYLDLSQNYISKIENFAFQGLQKLQVLNLKSNKISHIQSQIFSELYDLKCLIFEGNPLTHIEELSFTHLVSLQQLSLGILRPMDYQSKVELNLTYIFNSIPSGLTNLSISSGVWPIHVIIGSDSKPRTNLTLSVTGLTVSFEDCERPFFESVTKVYAHTGQLLCGSSFMGKYLKFVEDFEYFSSFTANFLDLTELNDLVYLRRLILNQIDFNRQPNLHVMFHNLSKLEELHLYGCRIDSLEGGLTKDLKSLTKLILYIENAFNMMESFIEHTMQLKYLYFYDSKLYCNCDNAWLIQWAKEQRQRELIMATSLDKLICKSDHNDLNFVTYVQHNCSTEVEFLLFVSSAFGLFFFMLVVLVHRLASAYLLALFHIARGWLDEALHRRAGTQYRYDAFVSYCGKDERWVFEELLPNLEERGPPFLRLCLHNRDFQLGKDIVDNITDSLYSSRRTLCLVSRHYLHSNWCSLELRLATYRLLVERKDILILVFLEKIPPFQLSAHHRMARLVKTRTYLDWPQDPHQRVMFWDRLRAKLAP